MNALLTWCRRNLAWSNSRESWQERVSTLLLLALAFALWWFGARLALPALVLLWGALVLAAAILLRRGWLKLFGPVLFYDMVRSARRGRYILLRSLYASLLLFLLFSIYYQFEWRYRYANELPHTILAEMAQTYFEVYMVVQLIVVTILTPAYVAGSIADEKTRKTLEFLLATDLRNREIVLSKLGSRLTNLTIFVLTGLPILSFLQFLGGVDPNLVLVGFAGTGLTMLGLAGVSILASTWCKRPRDAIASSYLTVFAYYGLSISLLLWQAHSRTFMGLPLWLDELVATVNAAINVFNTGNLFIIFHEIQMAGYGGRLAIVLPDILWRYGLFQGTIAAVCIGLSVWRLRAVALRQMSATKARRRWRGFAWPRPPVGDLPMMWKELHAEGGLRFHWLMWLITLLVIVATFFPVFLIVTSRSYYYGGGSWSYWDHLARDVNVWVRIMTPIVGSLTLLAVAVRAANCISSERDRQTLDSLLTTPLTGGQILLAKWLGNITSVKLAWLWLGGIWVVAMALGGLHPLAIPVLIWAWLVYAGFMSILGCWFSTISATSQRAVVYTLLSAVGLSVGHWLPWFCCIPLAMAGPGSGRALEHLGMFQAALTPPFALGFLSFFPQDFNHTYNHPRLGEMVAYLVIGIFIWLGGTLLLWGGTLTRFRRMTLRGSETPFAYNDQRHRHEPPPFQVPPPRPRGDSPPPRLSGAILIEEIQELPPRRDVPEIFDIPDEPPAPREKGTG